MRPVGSRELLKVQILMKRIDILEYLDGVNSGVEFRLYFSINFNGIGYTYYVLHTLAPIATSSRLLSSF